MRQKTVGELLADERKKAGLTVANLSERTFIQVDQLLALEENNFTVLPPAPFVKAFITKYAEECGVDPVPFIGLLRRDYKESAKGTLVPREFLSPLVERRTRLKPIRLLALILAGVFIALVGYSGFQWYQLQQPPELTISSPQDLARVGKSVQVQGATELEVLVSVNTIPVALRADGSFSTELEFATEGVIPITIEAKDARGKIRTIERHVVVKF